MLYSSTLNEIRTNINTGIEYEIALFYSLLQNHEEKTLVMSAIDVRHDASTIKHIISYTNTSAIIRELVDKNLNLVDVSFETQNDEVGPSDLVMITQNHSGQQVKIGLSVKYANTCTLNVTGMEFITIQQKAELNKQLATYTRKYIQEMTNTYGSVNNWFRKRKPSTTTDAFIDLIRDAVIANWANVNKSAILKRLYHADSPIEYWVYEYTDSSFRLNTQPVKISPDLAEKVELRKYQTSFVAFYLNNKRIGHMQVKFNNGFVEKCKKQTADIIVEGVRMSYGKPFSSWNFSVER